MDILEDILSLFEDESLEADLPASDFSFFDNGSLADSHSIDKISEQYDVDSEGAEEFLEITQSIQHSLGDLADQETLMNIDNYLDDFNAEPKRIVGLVNNVKGIYGEHQVIEHLQSKFVDGEMVLRDYATNTPDVDLTVYDKEGEILDKLQVKVSNDSSYILETRQSLPDDITIVTTDEVIEKIIASTGDLPDGIIGVGLSCDEITSDVNRTINILSQTEPEFDLLISDPVISEHLRYGKNPFEEVPSFGRQVHADKRYNLPIRWVYSAGEIDSEILPGTESLILDWNPADFKGVGDPLREAAFFTQQSTEFSCALATQRNIIESLTGEVLNEDELIQYAADKGIFDQTRGTLTHHLSAILKEKGLICTDYLAADFSLIENALTKGDKVMVGLDASEISNPLRSIETGALVEQPDLLHCLQVTGIDYSVPGQTKIIVCDSADAFGSLKAVSLEDFMSAWEDAEKRLTVISGNKG